MNSHPNQKRPSFFRVPTDAVRDYITSSVGEPLLRQLPWHQGTIPYESGDRPNGSEALPTHL